MSGRRPVHKVHLHPQRVGVTNPARWNLPKAQGKDTVPALPAGRLAEPSAFKVKNYKPRTRNLGEEKCGFENWREKIETKSGGNWVKLQWFTPYQTRTLAVKPAEELVR